MYNTIDFLNYKNTRRCVDMPRPKIKKEKMEYIEKRVNEILTENNISPSPSVDIVSLVRNDGFVVEPAKMDKDTTGRLIVDDSKIHKQRIISVNTSFTNPKNESNIILKKSRFITAHEYGHFVLHNEKLGQPTYAHRDTHHRTEPIEQEADYFARSILMPSDIFKKTYLLIKSFGIKKKKERIRLLSEFFTVTIDKASKRLEDLTDLGLI